MTINLILVVSWGVLTISIDLYSNCFCIFIYKGCYHLLSPGRRLTDPTVTKTIRTVDNSESCRQICDQADFECIAYSFGWVSDKNFLFLSCRIMSKFSQQSKGFDFCLKIGMELHDLTKGEVFLKENSSNLIFTFSEIFHWIILGV